MIRFFHQLYIWATSWIWGPVHLAVPLVSCQCHCMAIGQWTYSLVSSPLTLVVSCSFRLFSIYDDHKLNPHRACWLNHCGPVLSEMTRIDAIHVMRCCHWDIWSITTSCLSRSVTTDLPQGFNMPYAWAIWKWASLSHGPRGNCRLARNAKCLHRVFLRSHWGHHAEHVFLVIRVIVMSPECEDLTCLRQGSSF